MDQFSAVILAAGRGTRMRSSTPKVLHPILGIPMLDHVSRQICAAGSDDLTVVVGHGADQIRKHLKDSDVRTALQDPQRGTGHALLEALDQSAPRHYTLVVINGDLPDLDSGMIRKLVETHRQQGQPMTIVTGTVNEPRGMGRVISAPESDTGETCAVSQIVEEADLEPGSPEIHRVNLGIYAFDPSRILPLLRPMVEEDLSDEDPAKEAYLTRLVEVLCEAGMGVCGWDCGVSTNFAQVNDRRQLAQVSRMMQEKWQQHWMDQGVTIVDPLTTWIEVDVELGQDTVIQPNTVIRSGVQVGERCEIGPFAHLRSGTVLGDEVIVGDFVEVNRSRMETGSKAKHLAYLGDTQVGKKANIGAGAVIANYDGKDKHPTTIGEGAFIGSGSVVVAPGEIGSGATVAAGALVPPGKSVEPGTTVKGVPARLHKKAEEDRETICEDEKGN